MTDKLSSSCPCGSQHDYQHCCQPLLLKQQKAGSAASLMRSRFTANVVGDLDYLKHTWWPGNCPELSDDPDMRWLSLTINQAAIKPVQTSVLTAEELVELKLNQLMPDQYRLDWVSFTAIFQDNAGEVATFGQLSETSRFIWLADNVPEASSQWCARWLYLDGDADWQALQPTRNQICPCGSGLKFKRCCGG